MASTIGRRRQPYLGVALKMPIVAF